ncbi:MAG: hypothetical protein QXH12_01760 [Candidatus Caldarchaeum sp.]
MDVQRRIIYFCTAAIAVSEVFLLAFFLNISLRLEVGVFALAKAVYIHCGYVRRAVADGEAALGVSTRL